MTETAGVLIASLVTTNGSTALSMQVSLVGNSG
jgi:hypothetical protein